MPLTDPITAVWTGEVFVPDGNWSRAACMDALGAGEVTRLLVNPDGKPRTEKSHRHQFAWVRDALENLPEHMMDAPFAKNEDCLRKHALIKCGYCDAAVLAAGSEREARRMAAHVKALADKAHGYSITVVSGRLVYSYTPKSQTYKAMPDGEFQRSKQDILEFIAGLIGCAPEELVRNKRSAA